MRKNRALRLLFRRKKAKGACAPRVSFNSLALFFCSLICALCLCDGPGDAFPFRLCWLIKPRLAPKTSNTKNRKKRLYFAANGTQRKTREGRRMILWGQSSTLFLPPVLSTSPPSPLCLVDIIGRGWWRASVCLCARQWGGHRRSVYTEIKSNDQQRNVLYKSASSSQQRVVVVVRAAVYTSSARRHSVRVKGKRDRKGQPPFPSPPLHGTRTERANLVGTSLTVQGRRMHTE